MSTIVRFTVRTCYGIREVVCHLLLQFISFSVFRKFVGRTARNDRVIYTCYVTGRTIIAQSYRLCARFYTLRIRLRREVLRAVAVSATGLNRNNNILYNTHVRGARRSERESGTCGRTDGEINSAVRFCRKFMVADMAKRANSSKRWHATVENVCKRRHYRTAGPGTAAAGSPGIKEKRSRKTRERVESRSICRKLLR